MHEPLPRRQVETLCARGKRRTAMRCPTRFVSAIAIAGVSLLRMSGASAAGGPHPALPPGLDSFLAEEAHATRPDREALLAGNPLVKLLDADPGREVAVFGAIWVNAPPASY